MSPPSTFVRLGLLLTAAGLVLAGCATAPVQPEVDAPARSAEESPAAQGQSSEGINADFCDEKNFTEQVTNLDCSGGLATFRSTGLPSPSATLMVGITATNQQYARPHDYTLTIPLTTTPAPEPTTPKPGPIGVAVDGVPLFSPWTQAETRTHT